MIITDRWKFLKYCFDFFYKKVGFILRITGIVCEYNPLHSGHKKQLDLLRSQGHGIVCVMSGNFVQRGHPAIFDKMRRAKAAVLCGADLVLELPVNYALSSAEAFAAGGVQILSKLCDNICFGAETANAEALMTTAKVLLSAEFSEKLRAHLDAGLSFPAARQAAVADCGMNATILETPNNILAVEYCKAILAQNSSLTPLPIHRPGSYHDTAADINDPSATAVRQLLYHGESWQNFVPTEAAQVFDDAPIHSLQNGESAMLARLRTMRDEEFESLPFGSEGLWRKLMHASREMATLEQIATATKSKRYTRSRIDRMILCAYLGITEQMLQTDAPYARVLAFNDTGRAILSQAKDSGYFVNIGQKTGHSFELLEHRAGALYGLMATTPEAPDAERKCRVFYPK